VSFGRGEPLLKIAVYYISFMQNGDY